MSIRRYAARQTCYILYPLPRARALPRASLPSPRFPPPHQASFAPSPSRRPERASSLARVESSPTSPAASRCRRGTRAGGAVEPRAPDAPPRRGRGHFRRNYHHCRRRRCRRPRPCRCHHSRSRFVPSGGECFFCFCPLLLQVRHLQILPPLHPAGGSRGGVGTEDYTVTRRSSSFGRSILVLCDILCGRWCRGFVSPHPHPARTPCV